MTVTYALSLIIRAIVTWSHRDHGWSQFADAKRRMMTIHPAAEACESARASHMNE